MPIPEIFLMAYRIGYTDTDLGFSNPVPYLRHINDIRLVIRMEILTWYQGEIMILAI